MTTKSQYPRFRDCFRENAGGGNVKEVLEFFEHTYLNRIIAVMDAYLEDSIDNFVCSSPASEKEKQDAVEHGNALRATLILLAKSDVVKNARWL